MEWDRIEANWGHYKVLARQRWARMTPEELDTIAGHRERLASRIHELYGISRNVAQMQLESWQGMLKEPA